MERKELLRNIIGMDPDTRYAFSVACDSFLEEAHHNLKLLDEIEDHMPEAAAEAAKNRQEFQNQIQMALEVRAALQGEEKCIVQSG